MKQIQVKIYIEEQKKPIVEAILSSEKQLEFLKNQLNDRALDFIDFYEIIIKKSKISHITIKEN